ncbi:MAG: hypothetical protein ACJAVI_002899 [Candidatus Azotimanducaceae bacterium]|jgi:hypothetical protein
MHTRGYCDNEFAQMNQRLGPLVFAVVNAQMSQAILDDSDHLCP